MKKRFVLLTVMVFVFSFLLSGCEAENSKTEKVKMLFVGNSFTFTCDVPGQLKEIARIYGIDIEYEKITPGGVTLAETRDEAIRRMESEKFDYVVLQEHGTRLFRTETEEGSRKDFETLCDAAKETGATPVIFSPAWVTDEDKKPDRPMQEMFTTEYSEIAQANDAVFVNAGDTWVYAYYKISGISLYQPGDDYHANDAGAYLTACVFASTLFNLHVKDVPEYNMYHNYTDGVQLGQAAWEVVSYSKEKGKAPIVVVKVPDGTNEKVTA